MQNRLFARLCLLVAAACTGSVADSQSDVDPDLRAGGGGGTPSGAAGAPAGGGAGGQGAPRACAVASPGAVPLKRLSRTEHLRVLKSLFGDLSGIPLELPDDPSAGGFENNAEALGPNNLWWRDAFAVAQAVAQAKAEGAIAPLGCGPQVQDRLSCGQRFVREFGRRVFRRRLSSEEETAYGRFFAQTPGVASDEAWQASVQLTVQAMLVSPQFLYHFEWANGGAAHGYDVASRLSFFLWQSGPDDELLAAAEDGQLDTKEGVAAQVSRLVASERARTAFEDIARQWLDIDRLDRVNKLPEDAFGELRYPMREEARRFVGTLFEEGGSLADLVTSRTSFVDARLAPLYGVAPPPEGWVRRTLPEERSAGILAQSAFLASHAHPLAPSPVLRGVFVLGRLLCQRIPNPEAGVDVTPPAIPEGSTNRQAYVAKTEADRCKLCHTLINYHGYPFENFDTLGRYRDKDGQRAVDATGVVLDGPVSGARAFAEALAKEPTYLGCVARFFSHYAMGGAGYAENECWQERLAEAVNPSTELRALMRDIATDPMFVKQEVAP